MYACCNCLRQSLLGDKEDAQEEDVQEEEEEEEDVQEEEEEEEEEEHYEVPRTRFSVSFQVFPLFPGCCRDSYCRL
jgi:hypothetical protein